MKISHFIKEKNGKSSHFSNESSDMLIYNPPVSSSTVL